MCKDKRREKSDKIACICCPSDTVVCLFCMNCVLCYMTFICSLLLLLNTSLQLTDNFPGCQTNCLLKTNLVTCKITIHAPTPQQRNEDTYKRKHTPTKPSFAIFSTHICEDNDVIKQST